jgi:hypothetical protein
MQEEIKSILSEAAKNILASNGQGHAFKADVQSQVWDVLTKEFESVVGCQIRTSSDGQKPMPDFAVYRDGVVWLKNNCMKMRSEWDGVKLENATITAMVKLQISNLDEQMKIYDAQIQFCTNALKIMGVVSDFVETMSNIDTGVGQQYDRQVKMLTEKSAKDINTSYALMLAATATLIVALTPILATITLASTGVAIASAPAGLAIVCGVAACLLYNQSNSLSIAAKGDKATAEILNHPKHLQQALATITEQVAAEMPTSTESLKLSNENKTLVDQAKAHAKTITDAAKEISGLGSWQNR